MYIGKKGKPTNGPPLFQNEYSPNRNLFDKEPRIALPRKHPKNALAHRRVSTPAARSFARPREKDAASTLPRWLNLRFPPASEPERTPPRLMMQRLRCPRDEWSSACAGYSYSTTLTQPMRNSFSSGLPFTDWEAATMGSHFCTYCLAVSVFLQKSSRYFSAPSMSPLSQNSR